MLRKHSISTDLGLTLESALGHGSEIVELAEDIILCPRVC